jgi:signal transduction histidine kinase/CHASE1-domain containing sensor protein/ActR/RegA family two-component response regulator
MALAAWFAIHTAVTRDQENWIQTQSNEVESTINERFSTYVSMLVQTRAFFMSENMTDFQKFSTYVKKLELEQRFPGLLSVGFAKYVPAADLMTFTKKVRKQYPEFHVWPAGDRYAYIPVTVFGPLQEENRKALGFDQFQDPFRHDPMMRARDQDTTELTEPLVLARDQLIGNNELSFVLFVPVYSVSGLKTVEERRSHLQGFVYSTMHINHFFQATFGPPNYKSERVNFSLSYVNGGSAKPFYSRFDAKLVSANALTADRMLEGPLGRWRLTVEALPHAFPLYYRYFPDLVGLFFLFGAALIIYSIQNTSRQFFIEDEYRDQLIRSEHQVRLYSETLLRLNRASKAIFSEINLNELIKKIALVIADVVQTPSVAVFALGSSEEDSILNLRFQHGPNTVNFTTQEVPEREFDSWIGSNAYGVLHSNSMGAAVLASRLFKKAPKTWILVPILKRTTKVLSFIVAYSSSEIPVDDQTISILEGLSSQIATSLENSYLFARAEESNRLKSAFLANMSHEIRTPLGAIVGYADMLSRDSLADGARKETNQNMRKNVYQVTRIIDDILDLSKVEANKLDIIHKPLSFSTLLNDVKSVIDMKAQTKAIRFSIELETHLPKVIDSDEIRLKQILTNLIGNAIKFTDKGDVKLLVSYDQFLRKFRFLVMDTGCGISEEAQVKLFKPFSQADISTTRRFGGTGLGLALSRRLAHLLGGDITLVKSTPQIGTTFEIIISADFDASAGWFTSLERNEASIEIAVNEKGLQNRKILLVEDSRDNQEIFRFFLESAGAKITVAETGPEALTQADGNNFDLILMDIQIPEIDGKETTKILRKRGWTKPIIALTAHGLVEERMSVLAAGCDDQITKPVTGDQLIMHVTDILGAETAAPL